MHLSLINRNSEFCYGIYVMALKFVKLGQLFAQSNISPLGASRPMDFNFSGPDSGENGALGADIPGPRQGLNEMALLPREKRIELFEHLELTGTVHTLVFNGKTKAFTSGDTENAGKEKQETAENAHLKDRVEFEFASADALLSAANDPTPEALLQKLRAALQTEQPIVFRLPLGMPLSVFVKSDAIEQVETLALLDKRPITVISSQDNDRNYFRVAPEKSIGLFLEHHDHWLVSTQVGGGCILSHGPLTFADAQKYSEQLSTSPMSPGIFAIDSSLLNKDFIRPDGREIDDSPIVNAVNRWIMQRNVVLENVEGPIGLTILGSPDFGEMKGYADRFIDVVKAIAQETNRIAIQNEETMAWVGKVAYRVLAVSAVNPKNEHIVIRGNTFPSENSYYFVEEQIAPLTKTKTDAPIRKDRKIASWTGLIGKAN